MLEEMENNCLLLNEEDRETQGPKVLTQLYHWF